MMSINESHRLIVDRTRVGFFVASAGSGLGSSFAGGCGCSAINRQGSRLLVFQEAGVSQAGIPSEPWMGKLGAREYEPGRRPRPAQGS